MHYPITTEPQKHPAHILTQLSCLCISVLVCITGALILKVSNHILLQTTQQSAQPKYLLYEIEDMLLEHTKCTPITKGHSGHCPLRARQEHLHFSSQNYLNPCYKPCCLKPALLGALLC